MQWLSLHSFCSSKVPAMADDTDLHEFIHERYRRTDADLKRILEIVVDTRDRVSSLEKQVAGLRVDFANMRDDASRLDHSARSCRQPA